MSALLVAAALIVVTGSIAALASADPRLGLVGLAAALVGAALLADPLPGPALLGVRLTAALLAVATLRAAGPAAVPVRPGVEPEAEPRSHLGWPAEALLGAAGAITGLAVAAGLASFSPITGLDGGSAPAAIPAATILSATSLSLGVAGGLAAIALPALMSGSGLRRAVAAVLGTESILLARIGLAGPPGVLEEVALGALLVAVAATAALLASAGRAVREAGARAVREAGTRPS